MAGSLDSQSSCPCKARFIASMMNDVYETGGGEDGESENKQPESLHSLTEDETSQNKVYGRKIIILDYENEKPVPDLEVKIKTNNEDSYNIPDDNGRINTIITKSKDEDIMVDVFHTHRGEMQGKTNG